MAKTWSRTQPEPSKADGTAKFRLTEKQVKEPSLRGTFASVMLLGGFIIVSWVLVFALFLSRN